MVMCMALVVVILFFLALHQMAVAAVELAELVVLTAVQAVARVMMVEQLMRVVAEHQPKEIAAALMVLIKAVAVAVRH
jgi:hypothetical protein